jgi:hypothetical protein
MSVISGKAMVHCVVFEDIGCRIFSPVPSREMSPSMALSSPCRRRARVDSAWSLCGSVRRRDGCLIGVGPTVSITCDGAQWRLKPCHEITARPEIKCREMIRVALTDAADDAIASTLPKGAARWPMGRDRGQCFIQVEAAVVDRMRAMRRPCESYCQVISGLVELETSDLK